MYECKEANTMFGLLVLPSCKPAVTSEGVALVSVAGRGTSAAAGDSEVSDYANKEWSGLIASFYLPRWRAWLSRLEADLLLGRQYDAAAWRLEVLMLTYRWISTGSASAECPIQVADQCEQQAMLSKTIFAASQPSVSVQHVALAPAGRAVDLSNRAYELYARLLSPGCANTSATAAAAAAAAAAGMAAAPSSASNVVSTAAAIVVGAVGVAGQGAAAPIVQEVVA
jgi:hypothetical protein